MAIKLDNKHLREVLKSQGGKAVIFLKQLLKEKKKIASGDLFNSLDYEIVDGLNGLTLKILASEHFKYVDEGRSPGAKQPPIKPIESWIKTRHIVFEGMSDRQTAFVIARGIGENGIKPIYAKDKVIKELNKNLTQIIKGAVGKDIQDLLDKIFK